MNKFITDKHLMQNILIFNGLGDFQNNSVRLFNIIFETVKNTATTSFLHNRNLSL